jgi:site-specific recombinase XerD
MMEKYLIEHSLKNKAPKSYIRDKSLANHLIRHFGNYAVIEITPKLISQYKTKRRDEGAAPKTLNNELTLMGHAYNLATREWEWCNENPVTKISKEKVNNLIEHWLTFEEEARLLTSTPQWLREIIIFALNTGLRQGEIIDLQWPRVDLFRKTITILEQKNKDKDTLPLNEKALEVLKGRAKIQHIQTNHVFYNKIGRKMNARNLQRAFMSVTKKAELKGFRFHDLRHTFATRLIHAGVDIYTVQKLGRWKNISMVMRYAHHYPESLRSGVEALDKVKENRITILSH